MLLRSTLLLTVCLAALTLGGSAPAASWCRGLGWDRSATWIPGTDSVAVTSHGYTPGTMCDEWTGLRSVPANGGEPVSLPTSGAISPDGAKVASTANGIRVETIGEVGHQQLTDGHDSEPAWSPDGTTLVFTRSAQNDELWVVQAAGGSPRRLTHGDDNIGVSAFSPDGAWIA